MKRNPFPNVKLRRQLDGSYRPRFDPGPGRRGNWPSEDLRHNDGRWFTLDEVAAFAAARQAAMRGGTDDTTPAPRSVTALLDAYFQSPDFKRLRPRTHKDYEAKAEAIRWRPRSWADKRAGIKRQAETIARAPARAVSPANVKNFSEYLIRERGLAMAVGAVMVLSAAYSWARLAEGWELPLNPCLKLKLARPPARLVIWTADEVRAFVAAADAAGLASLGDAVMVALFSGQREDDVLSLVERDGVTRSLAEAAAAGEPLRFVQSKTGARVAVFAAPGLVARLADADRRRRARSVAVLGDVPIVLRETTGTAWDGDAFRKAFAKLRAKVAGEQPDIAGRHFADLRDTAVTWLARAGCTIPEIASISGHSLQSVTSVLKHYLELGEPLAREAARKIDEWMEREGVKL